MPSTAKLLGPDAAETLVRTWQRQGKKVVFTNGCFDILHAGHVHYLEKAKAAGDALLIGVNSDASVRRIKGEQRPVCSEQDRCRVLGGLESVDALVIFEEDTPEELIAKLLPDILIKGSDWAPDKIAGAGTVVSSGGEVKTIDLLEGRSTTGVIDRIVSIYCGETTDRRGKR